MFKTTSLLTAAVMSAACLGTAQAGVVAYYSFDTDYSDGAAATGGGDLTEDGTSTAITTTAGDVAFGTGAADFSYDGDHLSLDSLISFGASDAWSVSFWGKKRSGALAKSGMVLGTNASNNFIWTPDNTNVVQGLRFRNSTGSNADYGGFPDDAQYHHWVLIADGAGNMTVFRDNSNLGTIAVSNGTVFNIDSVGVGNGGGNAYDGQIDELYIFDEAISSEVVGSLFTSNAVPEPTSLALLGLGGLCMLRRRR